MKSSSLLPLVACGLALAALPAVASDSADKFKRLDADGDGRISRSEFVAAQQAKISGLDANNDGVITPTEASAASPAPKKHWWSRSDDKAVEKNVNQADRNSDGQVTLSEVTTASEHVFDQHDTNSDGFLSQTELDGMRK